MTALPDDIPRLREELDEIDRLLLATAARRNEIVQRIAVAKAASSAGRPLFDRAREREVYERARTAAKSIGLTPQTAHSLMQIMVEQSHRIQEEVSREMIRQNVSGEGRRILIVGGNGRMGRLLGRELAARGHKIDVLEAGDGRDRAASVRGAEITIVSVPMERAREVIEALAPHVRSDALLCDINSLKQGVCDAMAAGCAGEAVGLHPMFGPTVHSLRRQKVVVCPVRSGPRTEWLRRELGQMGLELIESDPVTHDRMMAVVQVLVHFSTLVMGEALRSTGISVEESLRYTSPIYRLELAFVGRLFAQNPDLYAEIEMSNPQGEAFRQQFLSAAEAFGQAIRSGDRDEFRALFSGVSEYFKGFADEAMQLSDFIIDAMVMQP